VYVQTTIPFFSSTGGGVTTTRFSSLTSPLLSSPRLAAAGDVSALVGDDGARANVGGRNDGKLLTTKVRDCKNGMGTDAINTTEVT
jgi:hypothetical protein